MHFFRIFQDKTTNLKKWHIFLAGLSTLMVVYILLSNLPPMIVFFIFAPWIIPLFLVFIDSMILYQRRELVPIAIGSLTLILLGFAGICTLICLDKWPGFFLPMQSICYILACLLSIVANISLVVRKPSGIFAASSRMLVLLGTICVNSSFIFGFSVKWPYFWEIPVYFIAPALGIIHNLQLLLRKKAKTPLLSVTVVCLLSIPLIIGGVHIWMLYMPSAITIEKLDLYGKWLEWQAGWD